MATNSITIPNATRTGNQESDSPGATIPGRALGILVQMTSPDWSNPSLAGKRVLWGVALSTDGGTTWGPGTCDNPTTNTIGGSSSSVPAWIYQTDTIGKFGIGGKMPSFQFTGQDITPVAGAQARLFCWPEVDVSLGAQITVTS